MSRITAAFAGLCLLAAPAFAIEPAGHPVEASGAGTAVVRDAANSQAETAAFIRQLLETAGVRDLAVSSDRRKAIEAFYAERDFSPLWLWDQGLNERARRLMATLSAADEEGLQAAEYLPPSLISFADDGASFAGNPERAARLDVEITRAALAFAGHASGGRIDPATLGRDMAIVPQPVADRDALAALSSTVRPDRYLAGLLPRTGDYARLRTALAKARARTARNTATHIPEGRLIRPGDQDERVHLIRLRLIELGVFELKVSEGGGTSRSTAAEAALVSSRYEDALAQALRKFQKSQRLTPDGIVGRSTISALNGPRRNDIDPLRINMERMRWLPRDLGRRHIMVNQAAFRLRLYEDSEIVHTANVVIGKRGLSTPVFSEEMEHIVFNPYWNVPRSIATKEMLPQLAQDPSYLARQGYEVFEMDGRKATRVESAGVSWWQVERQTFNYQIRQPPGRSNALGRLKFMFPNRFNIYLHDTPSKSLFSRASRAFSHGCVRLQDPQRLAEILLGWDKGWNTGKVAAMINSGRNQAIFLDRKIPVYLSYFTVWVDDDGEVAFLDDVYGRDPALLRAFVEYRVAMK